MDAANGIRRLWKTLRAKRDWAFAADASTRADLEELCSSPSIEKLIAHAMALSWALWLGLNLASKRGGATMGSWGMGLLLGVLCYWAVRRGIEWVLLRARRWRLLQWTGKKPSGKWRLLQWTGKKPSGKWRMLDEAEEKRLWGVERVCWEVVKELHFKEQSAARSEEKELRSALGQARRAQGEKGRRL